ncbi:MAG TPA: hypothetical protein PK598_13630, partial [Thermoanaerobaculia bacterium]|nr:hypothetical protein [Thermoanaerobaculia bacterium]
MTESGTGRSRHALLAAAAALGVLAAAAARLLPADDASLRHREELFAEGAGRGLDAGAGRVVGASGRIRGSREL